MPLDGRTPFGARTNFGERMPVGERTPVGEGTPLGERTRVGEQTLFGERAHLVEFFPHEPQAACRRTSASSTSRAVTGVVFCVYDFSIYDNLCTRVRAN